MHAPRLDWIDPRNPLVVNAVCPISQNEGLVGELIRGLLQGRKYYGPGGARLETVDEIIACLLEHRRVTDRPAAR